MIWGSLTLMMPSTRQGRLDSPSRYDAEVAEVRESDTAQRQSVDRVKRIEAREDAACVLRSSRGGNSAGESLAIEFE